MVRGDLCWRGGGGGGGHLWHDRTQAETLGQRFLSIRALLDFLNFVPHISTCTHRVTSEFTEHPEASALLPENRYTVTFDKTRCATCIYCSMHTYTSEPDVSGWLTQLSYSSLVRVKTGQEQCRQDY